jgi:hypothetical protein
MIAMLKSLLRVPAAPLLSAGLKIAGGIALAALLALSAALAFSRWQLLLERAEHALTRQKLTESIQDNRRRDAALEHQGRAETGLRGALDACLTREVYRQREILAETGFYNSPPGGEPLRVPAPVNGNNDLNKGLNDEIRRDLVDRLNLPL